MHILQPKHSKLSEKEAKELLLRYNVSLSQLPMIKITDPALPPGSKPGDIIKIERKSKTGKYFYYRVVVA
ncbi:MAG: DNA-directed RNA polymerase subunit RpoH/Rpb5 C-terminal domain-containing protein [Candidatus Pacearchaeota archaeon]